MLKIIKTIFIIVLSVVCSATTTVVLMLRYTKPIKSSIVESSIATSREGYPEQQFVGSVEMIVEDLVPFQEHNVEAAGSAQYQPGAARYFDYALLSKDIAAVSEKVGRFNEILGRKIQKLRDKASSGENSPP